MNSQHMSFLESGVLIQTSRIIRPPTEGTQFVETAAQVVDPSLAKLWPGSTATARGHPGVQTCGCFQKLEVLLWVVVKELKSMSYYISETMLFTIHPYYGNFD